MNLCPLLHTKWQSDFTIEERFRSEDHEVVAINALAAYADSFTEMYLTNPPCVEVDIKLVYKGRKFEECYCYHDYREPDTRHYIISSRKIRKETGVTFAMLMKAMYMEGSVCTETEVQVDKAGDEETPEEDEGMPEEEYEPWTERHVVENSTVHDEMRASKNHYPSYGMMRLDDACTEIRLHGVIVRTAADFAAIEKEAKQRKTFQAVLLELKQRVAGRAGNPCETLEAVQEC